MSSVFVEGSFTVVIFLVCLFCLLCFGVLWAAEGAKRSSNSGRSSRFEDLECRLPLDTQIGTVTMPYNGYLSAAIYDSDAQIVRTLLAQEPKSAGTVTLTWDGKDDFGRPVIDNGTYTWKALSSQVNAADIGFVGDSAFNPNDPNQDMGFTVQTLAVNQFPIAAGDIGGTFAQNSGSESYFGDTTLSQSYTLATPISASGTFFFEDIASMHGKFFLGHFSSSTADDRREFIGLEFEEGTFSGDATIGVRARIFRFNGNVNSDALSGTLDLGIGTGYYNWSYSYDPTYEAGIEDNAGGTHNGPEGRLTVTISNEGGASFTLYAINHGTHRDAGSTFDSFGMGIVPSEYPTTDITKTGKVFVDDVSYSGNTGVVDFNSNPGWTAVNNTSNGNSFGWNSYANIDSLLTNSLIEEVTEVKKLAQNGSATWGARGALGQGIADDGKYTYTIRHQFVNPGQPGFDSHNPNEPQEDRLYRLFSRDGGAAPFAPGVPYIVINSGANATDIRPTFIESGTGKLRYKTVDFAYTPFEYRTVYPSWGTAVDNYRIWVSDYRTNSVKIYNKADGAYLGEINSTTSSSAFYGPMGITVDTTQTNDSTHATVWIAYKNDAVPTRPTTGNPSADKGNTVAKFVLNGSYSSFTKTNYTALNGLNDPTGVTFGGPNNHLFVAISGDTQIREYTTSGTLVSGANTLGGNDGIFGSKHTGGALADNQFYWDYWGNGASIAIDSTGILSVNDDHRIQRFYTTTGGGHNAGELYQSIFSEFSPAPQQTDFPDEYGYAYSAGGKHYLLSGRFIYEVDPEHAGGPRAGWLGDGTWRLASRYYTGHGEENLGGIKLVTLNDNGTPRKFFYAGTRAGLAVVSVDSGQRMAAMLGTDWVGIDRIEVPKSNPANGIVLAGQYNWTDTNGNGRIDLADPNGIPSGSTGTDGEVTWFKAWGQTNNLRSATSPFVDSSGSVWYVDNQNNIVKYSVQGFDAQHNPIYNWANPTVVVPYDPSGIGFNPAFVRVAGNGDIYALGDGKAVIGTHETHGGGRWFARYDNGGNLLQTVPVPIYGEFSGMSLDENDSTPDYVYLGGVLDSYVMTPDGLLVSTFRAGPSQGGPMGWMDHPYSVTAFTHPDTEKTYYYGEEVFWGKSNRWEIQNLDTVQHFQGSYNHTYATGVTGQWPFNDTLSPTSPILAPSEGFEQANVTGHGSWFGLFVLTGGASIVQSGSPQTGLQHLQLTGNDQAFNRGVSLGGATSATLSFDWKANSFEAGEKAVVEAYTIDPGSGQWYFLNILTINDGQDDNTYHHADISLPYLSLINSNFQFRIRSQMGDASDFFYVDNLGFTINTEYLQAVPGGVESITPTYATGKVGNAISFNGDINKFLKIPFPSDFNGYTVAAWVKPDTAATNQVIVDRRSSVYGGTLGQIRINANGKFEHVATVGGVMKTITGNTIVQANTWYHISVTAKNDGFMHLYVNGLEEGTPISLTEDMWIDGDRFHVGGSTSGIGAFDGLVDDLRIYAHPLSIADIQAIAGAAVSVAATDYIAAEAGSDNGIFTITRTGSTSAALVVNYTMSGSATNGGGSGDYTSLNGAVTIPSGSSSVNVTVAPINDSAFDPSETVRLTLSSSANYLIGGSITDQLVILDNEATGDIGWFSFENTINGNNYGWSYNTNRAGGSTGEIGGTFAKNQDEHYYGDIHLTQSFTLNDSISAAGLFSPWTVSNLNPGKVFVGHFSQSTDDQRREFIGMEVTQDFGALSVRARINRFNGSFLSDAASEYVAITAGAAYTFDYTYDPDYDDPNQSHSGPEGRLALHITGSGGFNTTVYAINEGTHRDAGSTFDAFGMGMVKGSSGPGTDTSKTAQIFVDNLTYSGLASIGNVSVSATDANAAEQGQDPGVFTFTRTGSTSNNLVVNYSISGTATSGSDFSALASSVTIPSGSSTVTVSVTPIDDSTAESSETVVLNIASGTGYFIGSPNDATVTITDNEPTITVTASDASAAEPGSDTGKFVITRSNTTGNLVVQYAITGTATSGTDFSAIASSVTIASGSSTATITVVPLDDSTVESSETVLLTLSTNSSYNIGSPNNATVTITDNEPTITVTASDASAAEPGSDTGKFVITRSNTNGNLVVQYAITGTATSGSDFSALGGSVTIASGSSATTITVVPLDDSTAESSETVNLTLSSNSSYTIGSPNNATVTIADDEPTITVTASDASAAEPGSDTGKFVITRSTTTGNLVVQYAIAGTATNGTDFSTIASSVTISNGSSTATITVAPLDDSTAENSETVILTLSTNSSYHVGSPNNATVTITDDEPTVTITASDASAAEAGGNTGLFTITRTNTTGNLVVQYTVTGTATNGTDFSAIASSVTIINGSSTATITVAPLDDSTVESSEAVILTLSANSSYNIGSPSNAIVNIADNDIPTVIPNGRWMFENNVNDSSGANNGTFNGGTASYATGVLGNAIDLDGTDDYVHLPYATAPTAYTISAWLKPTDVTSVMAVARGSSNLSEASHVIAITSGSKFQHYVWDGFNRTVTGTTTVQANTWYHVAITASNSGMMRLYVNGVEEGTAVSIGTLWTGGDRFRVGISNSVLGLGYFDGLVDDVRIHEQVLSATEIQAIYSDTSSMVTVAAADPTAAEPGSDTGSFVISRSTTSGALAVYYTVNGTATSGSDYSAIAGSVTIANGSSTATITVTPIDDSVAEASETVALTISSNASYTVGTPNSATVNIADNEPTVTVTASDANAAELGTDVGIFTITRTNTTGNLVVNYAISGTATSGSDFSALVSSVTIANGQASATVTVTPIDDPTTESSETVILTLSSNSSYNIGSPSNATATIADNDTATVNPNGRWAFDNNLNDSVGANNGTFNGGTASYATGRLGSAIDLDGVDDYVHLPYATDPTAYTISAWVKPTDVTSVLAVARGSSNLSEASHVIAITAGSKFQHYTYDGFNKTVTGTTTVAANTWYHVAITASQNGMMRLYVNGVEEGTAQSVGTLWTVGDRYRVGVSNSALGLGYFDGLVDDLQIYDQALGAQQIQEIYGESSPTGQWKLDGNLNDSTGTNNGTFNGGTAAYASGKIGQAIDLDGVDDYVHLPYATDPTAYTISAWVKPTDVTSVLAVARGSSNLSEASHVIAITAGSKFQHYTYDGFNKTVTGTTTVAANTWYHVAITASQNGMMRLYVNGVEEGTAQSVGTLWTVGDRYRVGVSNSALELGYFDGLVDDLRIYEQVLSSSEIQAIYGEEAVPNGQWNFDNNVNDTTGTNNATFNGGTASYADGRRGSAIDLDGSNDYVHIPYVPGPAAYTITAWVKPTDVTWVNIISHGSANPGDVSDQLRISAGSKFEHFTWDGQNRVVTGTTTVQANTWYHVAMVASQNGMVRLYVNGVEEGTAVGVTNFWTGGDRFYVGNANYAGGFYDGLIDEVRIYEQVLTASQIQTIYEEKATPNGQWAFENNTNDATGTNNGTFNGGTAAYASGKIGQAIDLDGSNDYVHIPYATGPAAYTISAWVKPTDVTSVNIISRGSANPGDVSDQLRISAGSKFEHFTWDGQNRVVTGTTTVQANTWYHVAMVASQNGMVRLYVNGVEEGTAVGVTNIWTGGDRFYVGNYNYAGGFYDGLIDDVRIYEQVLSGVEIQAIYSDTSSMVTVAAADPTAAEPGSDTGSFVISRSTTSGALAVYYTVNGTATSGSDYSAIAGSVTIANGSSTATITVTPIDDSVAEASETVALTISSNASYTVGTPNSATVNIADDEPTVTVSASDSNAAEIGADVGTFTITRTNTTGNLVVNYAISGTATSGSDFSALVGFVTIGSGQSTAIVTVTPIDDSLSEGNETVVLSLSTNSNYTIGTPSSSTVTIGDNESLAINPNGRWMFDNNVNDSAGSNHGTFNGGTASYASGQVGSAIDLDGSNDYVHLPYGANVGAYTIMAWVKPTDVTGVNILVRTDNSGPMNSTSQQLRITANGKFEHFTWDGSSRIVTGTTTVQANTWYHVVISANNNGMVRLFVNGVEEGTAVSVGTYWAVGDRFHVGNATKDGMGFFDGLIDDVRVYDQTLSTSDIQAIYLEVPPVNPNGYWALNDNVNDSAGSNNGTFNGGTASYASGRVGNAIDLDGSNDYIHIPYSTSPSAYTIMAWVKPTDVTGVNVLVRTNSSGPMSNTSHQLRITANSKFEHFTWDGSSRVVTGNTTVQANTWYHVAIVASNGGAMRLYVNGQEDVDVSAFSPITTLWTGGDRFHVGNTAKDGMGFFDGLIDNLRVYDQALGLAEIVRAAGFAQDGFESGNGSGGFGWLAAWTLSGAAGVVSTGTPNSGTYHLQLTGNTGSATRAVSLSGVTSARLVFDWKANSFEAGETAVVEIFDGTNWITVQTIADGQDDNVYHHSDIDLSGYTLTSSFKVRFRSLMSAADDAFYIDNLVISQ